MDYTGIFRFTRVVIAAHAHGKIECNTIEKAGWAFGGTDFQFFECGPVTELYIRVDEGNLYPVRESFFLLVAHFGTEIRDNHIPTGKHAGNSAYGTCLAAADISHFHLAA